MQEKLEKSVSKVETIKKMLKIITEFLMSFKYKGPVDFRNQNHENLNFAIFRVYCAVCKYQEFEIHFRDPPF